MDRSFDIGDMVISRLNSDIIGKVIRFYTPTACEEQTLIKTLDGREYHAPTSTWVKKTKHLDLSINNLYVDASVNNILDTSNRIMDDLKPTVHNFVMMSNAVMDSMNEKMKDIYCSKVAQQIFNGGNYNE